MTKKRDHHPDIKGLVEDMRRLDNEPLNDLQEALSNELTRRNALSNGLDPGEQLQFETLIDRIRERTGLGDVDALAMVRAHDPKTPPLRGRGSEPQ